MIEAHQSMSQRPIAKKQSGEEHRMVMNINLKCVQGPMANHLDDVKGYTSLSKCRSTSSTQGMTSNVSREVLT